MKPTSLAVVGGLVALACAAGLAEAPGAVSTSVPAAATAHRTLPEVIGAAEGVRQLVTVSAPRFSSTNATLRAWHRSADGSWTLAHGPVKAVVGYHGWVVAARRKQSTGTTPAGRFSMPYAFGRLRDPGSRLRYRRVDHNDWWPYEPRDPATYNVYQGHRSPRTHWRPDKSEHLDDYTDQYRYALVVGFNLPGRVHYSKARRQRVAGRRADTRRGGGIFVHVMGDGLTAGCVAVPRSDMRWLLRWVRPRASPRLVMGPHDYIVKL